MSLAFLLGSGSVFEEEVEAVNPPKAMARTTKHCLSCL